MISRPTKHLSNISSFQNWIQPASVSHSTSVSSVPDMKKDEMVKRIRWSLLVLPTCSSPSSLLFLFDSSGLLGRLATWRDKSHQKKTARKRRFALYSSFSTALSPFQRARPVSCKGSNKVKKLKKLVNSYLCLFLSYFFLQFQPVLCYVETHL